MKYKPIWALMVLATACAMMIVSCGGDSNGGPAPWDTSPYATRIYMLAAQNGNLTPLDPAEEGNPPTAGLSWLLTLEGLNPGALWYTDRPDRAVGNTSLTDYANTLWSRVYGSTDPNATIQFDLGARGGEEGVFMVLSDPSYDAASNSMRFHAEMLNHTLDQTPTTPLYFSDITVNVLNNATDDQEVASYVQYADGADLYPTGREYEYQLMLSDAGPEMFWVDNAPGRYSDKAPMSYFFPQWDYLFGDDPPNAALFGTNAAGALKLFFLTLTDPLYDEALGQVTYRARLLGQTSGPVENLHRINLNIDSGTFSRFPLPGKGTAYQAFSHGYDPSTANTHVIYFGSDIARKEVASLWGTQSNLSVSCAPYCRDDLQTLKGMGINLIRLYDWDPRNDHSQFLDYAHSLGIKVVVPISNWLPQNPGAWDAQVPLYFKFGNYGNSAGTDWHPAVAGVIISNELDNSDAQYSQAIGLVARFLQEADKQGFGTSVPVGIPITFVPRGAPYGPGGQNMPGWNQFNKLLTDPRTAHYRDRLMLCSNTYNSKDYLFANAESTGQGWVQLTYQQFGTPILFTEIGYSRVKSDYTPDYIKDQLEGVLTYQKAHPEQILGACHFQFSDKVWKQGGNDTEGAFGSYTHSALLKQIQTVQGDFSYWPGDPAIDYGILTIDKLEPTSTYNPVIEAYQ